MRHYMVDPDNEDRLLKVPPDVVAGIKAEALSDAVNVVEALTGRNNRISDGTDWLNADVVIQRIKELKGQQ